VRPLETVLVVVNLGAFVVLVTPFRGKARWVRYTAVIPPLITGTHLLVEGPRWQMIPAYALGGLVLPAGLAWPLRNTKPARASAGRTQSHRRAARIGIGLGVLGLATSTALPTILPVFRFPHPTGPYDIGTLTYHWVDVGRPEVFAADRDARRELMVQIWYPAKGDPSSPRTPYIQDADVVAPALARFVRLPEFALAHLKYVMSNAIPSAPVADGDGSFPVLIFLEGLGGYRQMNTFQVEELVSHGYIVAAIDQPYAASMVVYPDGREAAYDSRLEPPHRNAGYDPRTAPAHSAFADAHIPYFAQDVSFTLDQLTSVNQADPNGILTGRLDLQRSGLFGHSLGGIVGGEACLRDPRLRACLLEDAYMTDDVVQTGLTQPTMWITRDADTMRLERQRSGGWSEAAIHEHLTTMRAVHDSLPGDGYYVQVPGSFHVDMNDVPMVSPLAQRFGLSGPIGADRAHRIINAYTVAFFDRHLKNKPAPLLDGPATQYPEVRIETRRQ
jgi:predicted dienelactone hydrolase